MTRDRSSDTVALEASIARIRAGDRDAFEDLVRRYEGLVLRVARRMTGNREDALDVSQETFLRIYRSLGRFRTGRKFESWVYRIVVHASYDLVRRRGRTAHAPLGPEAAGQPIGGTVSSTPESHAERAQLRERLDGLLEELAPRLRAVFVLRDVEGLDTAQIARILGCREVTVRRHSMQAREKMRTLLNSRYPGLAPGEKSPKKY